ncbi:MAG: hypothetical protein HKM02_01005 [Pseudomonadales bacterium]|nr:hypothetical protein [Pseudomonadales bacterium]
MRVTPPHGLQELTAGVVQEEYLPPLRYGDADEAEVIEYFRHLWGVQYLRVRYCLLYRPGQPSFELCCPPGQLTLAASPPQQLDLPQRLLGQVFVDELHAASLTQIQQLAWCLYEVSLREDARVESLQTKADRQLCTDILEWLHGLSVQSREMDQLPLMRALLQQLRRLCRADHASLGLSRSDGTIYQWLHGEGRGDVILRSLQERPQGQPWTWRSLRQAPAQQIMTVHASASRGPMLRIFLSRSDRLPFGHADLSLATYLCHLFVDQMDHQVMEEDLRISSQLLSLDKEDHEQHQKIIFDLKSRSQQLADDALYLQSTLDDALKFMSAQTMPVATDQRDWEALLQEIPSLGAQLHSQIQALQSLLGTLQNSKVRPETEA